MSARVEVWKAGLLGCVVFAAVGGVCLACSAQEPAGGGEAKRRDTPPACEDGYRRTGLIHDFTLDRGWTIYADCAHPERPMVAVASEGARPLAFAIAPVNALPEAGLRIGTPGMVGVSREMPAAAPRPEVESGASVRVWRRDGVAAINLAAIALESGAAGARIRVRLRPGGAVLRGTVRAPGSVELDPPGSGGFAGEGR